MVFGIALLCFSLSVSSSSSASIVLVTGFEPFMNYTVNPSGVLAEALNGTVIENSTIIGVVLPVDFNASFARLMQAIDQYQPVLLICTGLNAKAHQIRVETITYNLMRYQKDDGTWSFPRRIDPSGPFLRPGSLPSYEIMKNIRKENIPVRISFFPGTYVCNWVFYQSVGYLASHQLNIRVGFIHVPLFDSQDPDGLSLQQMSAALLISIQTSLVS